MLILAGCDASAPVEPQPGTPRPTTSVPSPTGAFQLRPLRLPSVPAGGPCPVTPRTPWSGPGVAGAVLGEGPLYPVADYFRDGVLQLRDTDRRPAGGYEVKVRWIGAGYAGPVLVRAGRIDGKGAASVTFSNVGEKRDGGHYAELNGPTTDIPATTSVDGPGCYAYQVDGTTFSTVIVFRAALG
ncbi:hypothetical protein [Micromonospora pattaloongensis]|nr:hypothetical protein [Micromonospora pattaloongensis]